MNPSRFIELAAEHNLSYNAEGKAEFLAEGKKVLAHLAKLMGLAKGTYSIRINPGGIAVSGDIILHSDLLYVHLSQSALGNSGFYWRTVAGRKDYVGRQNRWENWNALYNLPELAAKMDRQAKADEGKPSPVYGRTWT